MRSLTRPVTDERLREIVTNGELRAADYAHQPHMAERVAMANDLLALKQVVALQEKLPPRVHDRIARALERIADFLEGRST